MRVKHRRPLFACCISENSLTVLKCLSPEGHPTVAVSLDVQDIPVPAQEKTVQERLGQSLLKLGYRNHPLIVSLPRSQATCRILKVPTVQPNEIERIVSLQASNVLPFPAEELTTGYDIISIDREGFALLNMIIVHRDSLERYLKILRGLHVHNPAVVLSSYGIAQFYAFLKPHDSQTATIVEISSGQAEAVIVSNTRLLFSRSFTLNKLNPEWGDIFIDEMQKTHEVYMKEMQTVQPAKVVLMGHDTALLEWAERLSSQLRLPVETLAYKERIKGIHTGPPEAGGSLVSLIGLVLHEAPQSLQLLPQSEIEKVVTSVRRTQNIQTTLLSIGIVVALLLGTQKGLDNKRQYLKELQRQLQELSEEARPLESIEKRLSLLESRAQEKTFALEALSELHRIMPAQTYLLSLSFEEDNQIVLHGQSRTLGFVLMFVSGLEKSTVLKDFHTRLRYATQKRTGSNEVVDFEIICARTQKGLSLE